MDDTEDGDLLELEPDEPPPPLSMPDEPISAPFGSEERVSLMAVRFERRQELYHPDDVRTCDDLPVAVEGEVYAGVVPGVTLRTRSPGKADYFVSMTCNNLRVVRRFKITELVEATKYAQDAKRGLLEGVTEQVEYLFDHQ